MIFVTLGSQKFQFNRLLVKIDTLVEAGVITEPVFAQIGYSTYKPAHYAYERFLDHKTFHRYMAEYDTIITHAGTGTIIAAVTQHKNVIAVPRLSQFGEHVDDHQLEILQRFGDMNLIDPCYDIDDLENQLIQIQTMQFAIYESNTGHIAESIEEFIACM